MSGALKLRTLEPGASGHARAREWLLRAGVDTTQDVLTRAPHLRFVADYGKGEIELLVPANRWAAQHCPPLQGMAWERVAVARLQALAEAYAHPFSLPDAIAGHQHLQLRDCVQPGALQGLAVATVDGPVWITEARGAMPFADVSPVQATPMTVELRLATVALSAAEGAALAVGDVLLLGSAPHTASAWLGTTRLFDLDYQEFQMEIISSTTTEPALQVTALGSLSIPLDVVLCQLPFTVAELNALTPGSVIPVPAQAHLQVQLRDAGRVVALGELVQLDDVMGLQLHRIGAPS